MKFVDGKNDGTGQIYDVKTALPTRHAGTRATSGQNEADRVCNIYDLEGNYYEYVAEKHTYNSSRSKVTRGGDYDLSNQAVSRYISSGSAGSNKSFRLVLYIM